MGDLTRNLSRWEFSCKCGCGFDTVDVELVPVLQDIVDHFSRVLDRDCVIIIDSGCRCVEHNETVQKEDNPNYVPYSSKSQHMFGRAADIVIKGVHSHIVYTYVDSKYPNKYGIGRYKRFTHIDTASGPPRRW